MELASKPADMSDSTLSSLMRKIQQRRSIVAHVEVLHHHPDHGTAATAPYYFNTVSKTSTWVKPPSLFDWCVEIRGQKVTFRNRVDGATSEHVPLTLHKIITENFRALEVVPPRSGIDTSDGTTKPEVLVEPTPAAKPQAVEVTAPVGNNNGDDNHDEHEHVHNAWRPYVDEASGEYYWCVQMTRCLPTSRGVDPL